jgi:hypothetical protein
MAHKPFSDAVQVSVVTKCKRRCALCFGLDNDYAEKRGQLAHIDRDGQNTAESNAAYLCSLHHDLYDATSLQTKGYMPGELKSHQETLWAFVTTIKSEAKDEKATQHARAAGGVGVDVYDRRVPIYRTTRQFVRDVCESLRPELQLILKFARDTDEALFLFDGEVAEYLQTLFKKALRLHTTGLLRERMLTHADEVEKFQAIAAEDMELALWFNAQLEEIRARFAPFLQLRSKTGPP